MYRQIYNSWLNDDYFDQTVRDEFSNLSMEEIEDRFYKDLEFGTGGLRGVIAAGTNRMNKYVIRKATQGLAEQIVELGTEAMERGVVIAYDSRRFSKEFALESALVLARNGVKAYLFTELRPTPELSFAVRHLGAIAGIVITASHNPKEYNGYKVYWEDGGQVPPTRASQILAKIREHELWTDIHPLPEEEALNKGLLIYIGEEVDKVYIDKVKELTLYPALINKEGKSLKIVYSPLYGTGNIPVRRALAELGFSNVFVVPEQEQPDQEFPTAPYPNPEIPSTFDLARKYGAELGADLLFATDPDADRLGVVVKDGAGDYVQLTGNQIGVILTYYLLTQRQKLGTLRKDLVLIKTNASTDLADIIALDYGIKVDNVLTGFKFIAERIQELQESGEGEFLFGFEESYGFLAGDFVRDKDAVIAAVLVCEAALYYKHEENRGLYEVLEEIYSRYGYFLEDQESITLQGKEGTETMDRIMTSLRNMELKEIGGFKVARVEDFLTRVGKDLEKGTSYDLTLPKSNVIRYSLSGGGFVMVRPSGTEPKIKFYFSVKDKTKESCVQTLDRVKGSFMELIRSFGIIN